jgi:hypothetical protein
LLRNRNADGVSSGDGGTRGEELFGFEMKENDDCGSLSSCSLAATALFVSVMPPNIDIFTKGLIKTA